MTSIPGRKKVSSLWPGLWKLMAAKTLESFDFCMTILENRNNMQVDGLTRETREQGTKNLKQT